MLTRRQLLQLGILGGAAVVLPWERAMLAFASSHADLRFAAPLSVPPVLAPESTDDTTDYYRITMRVADLEVLPGRRTTMWTYGGMFPGPTIRARRGRRAVVTQVNELGVPTSVHLHGGHTSPESDGHAADLIPPGSSKVYTYPNRQRASTLWYHDHAIHETSRNVYMGLAAAYLLDDEAEDDLGLPGGDADLPLVLTDRSFAADGSLEFGSSHDNELGDVLLVNGRPWPFLRVGTRRYRLRFVNASNSRDYDLALDTGQDLVQIASDGGLLAAPHPTPSIRLAPAERAEVVVDFSDVPVGTSVILTNLRGQSAVGTDEVLRFDVVREEPATGSTPASLATIPPPGQASVERDIVLDFDLSLGLWVIDGRPFDTDRIDARPQLGVPEVWRVHNASGAPHPFHVHLDAFRVLDRDGIAPLPGEAGWKDTAVVAPGETVRLLVRLTEFTGRYVYHCHNLAHEDHDMMAQLEVAPAGDPAPLERVAGDDRYGTAAALSAATFPLGAPVAFVATGRDYPDALAGGVAAGRRGGPLLLVGRDAVPDVTGEELRRLAPQRIVLLGGSRAVDGGVEQALAEIAPVERIAGDDRYATAAQVSARTFPAGAPVAFVATGRDYPDALAGAAAAANRGGPVLLVGPDAVPDVTAGELRRLQPARIMLLGGPGAVSETVEQALGEVAPVERIAGDDRYATAVRASEQTFALASTVVVATGWDHPDALAGSAAAAASQGPVLLVGRDTVPDAVSAEIVRVRATRVVLLGGPRAVSETVAEALRDAVLRAAPAR